MSLSNVMNTIRGAFMTEQQRRDAQVRELEDRIIRCEQIRNFFETDTGKYIEKCMEDDIETIKNKLLVAKYDDIDNIQSLQNQFQVINTIKGYFARAILAGEDAKKILFNQNIEE